MTVATKGVLQQILDGHLAPTLGGERREICVLFADIRAFTTLSEHLPPEVLSELLNRHFECMTACIHRHAGTLDKLIDDGIMAFFGAPVQLRWSHRGTTGRSMRCVFDSVRINRLAPVTSTDFDCRFTMYPNALLGVTDPEHELPEMS
jgi:class 3 adenylate cyclase